MVLLNCWPKHSKNDKIGQKSWSQRKIGANESPIKFFLAKIEKLLEKNHKNTQHEKVQISQFQTRCKETQKGLRFFYPPRCLTLGKLLKEFTCNLHSVVFICVSFFLYVAFSRFHVAPPAVGQYACFANFLINWAFIWLIWAFCGSFFH